jgi:hypothetical protein
MEVSGQFHTLITLSLGEKPWYLMARRLGGAQSRSGHCGEENISYLCQESNLDSLAIQPVAVPTGLSHLPTPRYDYKLKLSLCRNIVMTKGDGLSQE